MSTKVMAKCWPLQVTASQKAVLISLADNANDDGVCWPSVALICERTCLCERVVRRVIAELETLQLLVADRVPGKSTSYTLTPALHAPLTPALHAPLTPALDAPLHDVHPCTTRTTPLHQMHHTPAPDAPPYIEPSLNRQRTVNRASDAQISTFDQFWTAYPNKVGKGAAEKAWTKIKPDDALLNQILTAIAKAKQSAQWRKAGPPPHGAPGDFIPHPATWLNQRRWLDQLTPAVSAQQERGPRFKDVN